MPPLSPWTLTELCKLLISLVSLLLPDKRKLGQCGSLKENNALKCSFSCYFPPFKWQNFLELFLRSNRSADGSWTFILCSHSRVKRRWSWKVTAQRKGGSVTGRGNGPDRDWTGSPWTLESSLSLPLQYNTLIPFRRQMGVKVNYFFRP